MDALSFLCQEDSLHKMLVEGNVLPALIRQSNMDQPQDFRRNALQAMVCICSACMSNPPAGDLSLQTVNNALNLLFESAQAAKDDSVVGKQAMEVIGGLASTVAVLKVRVASRISPRHFSPTLNIHGYIQTWIHGYIDACILTYFAIFCS